MHDISTRCLTRTQEILIWWMEWFMVPFSTNHVRMLELLMYLFSGSFHFVQIETEDIFDEKSMLPTNWRAALYSLSLSLRWQLLFKGFIDWLPFSGNLKECLKINKTFDYVDLLWIVLILHFIAIFFWFPRSHKMCKVHFLTHFLHCSHFFTPHVLALQGLKCTYLTLIAWFTGISVYKSHIFPGEDSKNFQRICFDNLNCGRASIFILSWRYLDSVNICCLY